MQLKFEPGTYAWWQKVAEALLLPLSEVMVPGRADLPLRGHASNHGPQADRLESFARPCLLAAHWLASNPGSQAKLSPNTIAKWFRQGLLAGTDPQSPHYWGPTANHHQHTVEMAALTLAFQIARRDLWDPLSPSERDQIAHWLATIRGAGLHRNNHMFFNIMTLAFLGQEGYARPADALVMRHLLDIIESMSLGGGWFIDGMNETIDYYQAYAFHYYGPWWAKLYGQSDPARAQRWKTWLHEFLSDYIHFFAPSGENPPFGRSMCYRFAATAPFALGELYGVSPIPPGQARRACTRNLQFFLSQPILQEQGALSLGWTNEFPELCEAYSCAGSPYWAAKGFAPLLLPPEHPFWEAPEEPLPSEKQDFARPIPQAGLVVRSCSGEIEVLNNANGITVGNSKFGTWKWGKLSFRTGIAGEIAPAENRYPADASLTAELPDGTVFGRQQCQPLEITSDHCGSVYALGDRFTQNQVSVESRIWWRGEWQFHWHHVDARQPVKLRLGTYSLPLQSPMAACSRFSGQLAIAQSENKGVGLQILSGFERILLNPSDPGKRTHILAPHSLLLLAVTDLFAGERDLLALTWVGHSAPDQPSTSNRDETTSIRPWSLQSATPARIVLQHRELGTWIVDHPGITLSPLPPRENLQKILGNLV